MNTTISRSINYGNKLMPFFFTGGTMSEQQHKLRDCAKKLSITPERYLDYLEYVNEHPIVGPIGKTLFVKENVHRKVEKLFDKQTEPVNEVNDEKDFKLVQHQIEKKLRKDFTISNKRNTAKFYSPAKVKEWESLVQEINKYFRDIHFIDEKLGIETIYAGFLKHYKFNYDPLQKIPVLRFKKHSRYGHELYLEFFINQDLKTDGVKNLKRKIFRVSGDLNNISDAESLYTYVIRFAFSIFLKIKAGYYVTYTPNVRSMKFSEIEKLPIGKHYLIPTLYAYLEHFYEKRTYKKGQYDTIKSDLNTLVKYIHKLPRKLPIDLTKLEHTVKFLDFDKVSGIKFLEYLQINKDTKTGEPIVGITIKNIFSSLGNLMNKVKEYRND
ncbi:MAG TPA: hypothetical protein VKG26_04770, partial [Bacteroidia bacterium]|nr:hypothetical protein [Bacteroidia bacterium]